MINLIKKLLKIRIINFMVVGGLGFCLSMIVYYPLTLLLKTHVSILGQSFYLPATLISIPCAISFNYWMNKKWTYKNFTTKAVSYGRYLVMGLATAVLDVVLLFVFVQYVHIFYMLAYVLATIIMFLCRYFISNVWIWNTNKKVSKVAYDWNAYYNGNIIQKWWKREIVKYTIEMSGGNPILDVGCGTSPLLSLLKAEQKFGVDVNNNKVMFMQKKDPSSRYTHYQGFRLPFVDNRFDTVICNEVIEHHHKPNELVKELSRVTVSGGIVIISTPDYSTFLWNIVEFAYGIVMKAGYKLEHKSKFTKTSLESLANAYRLELESYKKVAGCDLVCKFRKI